MGVLFQAVGLGMLIMLAGTVPRNIVFFLNLRLFASLPWAVPLIAAYMGVFWWYLKGGGAPAATREFRRITMRANAVSARCWFWALLAGGLGLVALVFGLRLANRLVMLPPQQVPDLSHIPVFTIWALLMVSAPVAGIIEEAAFRGYMQGPLERRFGLTLAILITGTMFAVAHLDFTLVLWPYYVAVAALYGVVTHLTNSILPAVVLHTVGNLYSNFDLLFYGQAEWQAPASPAELVWSTGADAAFAGMLVAFLLSSSAMLWAFRRLSVAAKPASFPVGVILA